MTEKKFNTSMPEPGTEAFDKMLERLNEIAKDSHRKYLRMEQEAESKAAQIILNC